MQKIEDIESQLDDIEFYSPTMPMSWQDYHVIIRELIKKMDDRVIAGALNYYCDWIGFRLTKEQFLEILESGPRVKLDLMENGPDTSNRESFMDLLAQKVVGRKWPEGSASKGEVEEFYILMKAKGRKLGYGIPEDYDAD